MGEMCSALPFSGGIFGFVRAAIGPYNGFIVACCEFVYCMSYIAIKVQRMVSILTETESTTILEDQFAILGIFGFCLVMNLIGGKPIFMLTSFLGFFIFMMLMIYLFGTLSKVGTATVNFTHYAGPFHPVTWDSLMGASHRRSIQWITVFCFIKRIFKRSKRTNTPYNVDLSCFLHCHVCLCNFSCNVTRI